MTETAVNIDAFVQLGEAYTRAFDSVPVPEEHLEDYDVWLLENADHELEFPRKMAEATAWIKENPEVFSTMIVEFNKAIDWLTLSSNDELDENLYPNIKLFHDTRYNMPAEETRRIVRVPTCGAQSCGAIALLAVVEPAAVRLRLGETIEPADGKWYKYHLYSKSAEAMVATSIVDLYESYARTSGFYPEEGDTLSLALTEALHLLNPKGKLFGVLKDPETNWINGYDGFSDSLQAAIYGEDLS